MQPISRTVNRVPLRKPLRPFYNILYPTEKATSPGLITNNQELLDFESTTITKHGLIIPPSTKKHISKFHFCVDERSRFNDSVCVVNLLDNMIKSVIDNEENVFTFGDFDSESGNLFTVKVVYECKDKNSCIGKSGSTYAIAVINPETNEVITVSPCSKNKFITGKRISSLAKIDLKSDKDCSYKFILNTPINNKRMVRSSFGLIFNKIQACAASMDINHFVRKKAGFDYDILEFDENIDILKFSDEIMEKYFENSKDVIPNCKPRDINVFDYKNIILLYERNKDLPPVSVANSSYTVLKFSPSDMKVIEFRPCSKKEFDDLKRKCKNYRNSR